MANAKVYTGKVGAQELYKRLKGLIPPVDESLDANSHNPISNRAVTMALADFGGFQKVPGDENNRPVVEHPSNKVIYLVEVSGSPEPDHCLEWIWSTASGTPEWVCIGTTSIDVDTELDPDSDNPVSNGAVCGGLAGKTDKEEFEATVGTLNGEIALKADQSDVDTAVNSLEGSISDLSTHVEGEIAGLVSGKADRDADAVSGNLAEFDENGNPIDSGKTLDDIMLKADVSLPLNIVDGILTNNGDNLTVTGTNAWAEGKSTTSSGYVSHAEGYSSTASGAISHAEGYGTIASGGDSHAEGYETTASGSYAHSQGIGTVASGTASMATGQYNLDSTGLLVVGNGSKTNNVITRSDCFKIDSTGKLHFLNYGTLTELNFDTTTFQTQLDGLLVEEGEPLVSEPDTVLFSRLSGNELLARRAYEDENGENIKDTYATKAEMQAALGDIETLLAAL